ncbi:MAG: hypothetical protein HC906_14420 [Bacteroidales bacterium]|nr:hypothetical protein [Bacteroidales bacterium]
MDLSSKVISVAHTQPVDNKIEMNISEFPDGIYMLKILGLKFSIIRQIIIKKIEENFK